jgi:hypothetical protein
MILQIRFYFNQGIRHDIYMTYESLVQKVMPGFILTDDTRSFSGPELDHLIERLGANRYILMHRPKPILAIIRPSELPYIPVLPAIVNRFLT